MMGKKLNINILMNSNEKIKIFPIYMCDITSAHLGE